MCQLRRLEKLIKELARAYTAVVAHGPPQARAVESARTLLHAIEHFALRFRQRIEIVHQIDQQKFPGERFREVRLDPERKLAPAQLKVAMTFMIIDHRLVVELSGGDAEAVIGVG